MIKIIYPRSKVTIFNIQRKTFRIFILDPNHTEETTPSVSIQYTTRQMSSPVSVIEGNNLSGWAGGSRWAKVLSCLSGYTANDNQIEYIMEWV